MRKIAFIGNSHLACIRKAWINQAVYKNRVDAVFYAASSNWFRNIKLLGERFEYHNSDKKEEERQRGFLLISAGEESIRFGEYDEFYLVGYSFRNFVSDLFDYPIYAASSYKDSLSQLISDQFAYELLKRRFQDGDFTKFAGLLKKVTDKAVNVISGPCPDKGIVEKVNIKSIVASDLDLLGNYYDLYNKIMSEGFSEMNISYFAQPLSTMECPGYTKSEFSLGGIGVGVGQLPESKSDSEHMNSTYGLVVLRTIFENDCSKTYNPNFERQ